MAVSHVALIQALAANAGLLGKFDAKQGVISAKVDGITDAQIKALASFKAQYAVPMELKRVETYVRLTIGLVRQTLAEKLADDESNTLDFATLVQKSNKNGEPGFNIKHKLSNAQFNAFLAFYAEQGKAMTIKRSGAGLRFNIDKQKVAA